MSANVRLRWLAGALVVATAALWGWGALWMFLLASLGMLFVCLGISGSLGERVWLRLVVGMWLVIALIVHQPNPARCGPDDPVGCLIRR